MDAEVSRLFCAALMMKLDVSQKNKSFGLYFSRFPSTRIVYLSVERLILTRHGMS